MEQHLLTQAQQKFKTEKLSDYFSWVRAVWLNSKGKPLDFERRKYLVGIYQDQAKHVVFMKAAQMGLSERGISETVWLADIKGKNTLYAFPTQHHLQEFVQARLNPVLNLSDYLKDRVQGGEGKKVETLGLKKIGLGDIYFRGSTNEKQIITVDADMVVMDERDRFDEQNVPFLEKRLLASDLKWMREISTPTIPKIGIHYSYLQSDMRVWQVQCKKCGEWQELDFFKNVNFTRAKMVCSKCGMKIKRFGEGRWYITNPKSKIHGYRINGLYNPSVTTADVIHKYKKARREGFSALQQFYNQDLGLPYEVVGKTIQMSELDNCQKDYEIPVEMNIKAKYYAGVDIGAEAHHTVVVEALEDDRYRIVWAGLVKDFFGPVDSIEQIINAYSIKLLVVDRDPEKGLVRQLIAKFPGRVFAASYPSSKFTVKEYFKWDLIKYELKLDRTISLDYVVSDIQNRVIELPRNIGSVSGFYDQLRALTRTTQKNKRTGEELSFWVETTQRADHYFHALNFARMAQTRASRGKALLDYYATPNKGLTPGLIDWIRINSRRL